MKLFVLSIEEGSDLNGYVPKKKNYKKSQVRTN